MRDTNKVEQGLTKFCIKSGQRILRQVERVRQSILAQFRDLVEDPEHALRLALNEAEALAWQTPYPHLVFADLAEEKARAVAAWSKRQRAIRR